MTVLTGPHIGLVVEGPGDKDAVPILLRAHLTAAARPGCQGVLVVLDSDSDPACKLGPNLTARAQAVTAVPIVVSLAERCFEDWLYASIETLGLGVNKYVERRRGPVEIKVALGKTKYVKPIWQPRLASRIDLDLARQRSPSLDRLLCRFDRLCSNLGLI